MAEEYNEEETKLDSDEETSKVEKDSDFTDEEGKEEGKLAFTSEGEGLGYVSLDQARVLAVQHARDNRGYYGRASAKKELVWEVIGADESEDYYDVRLSYRIAGTTRGKPGIEQFTIDKVGAIELRQILNRPSRQWVTPVSLSVLVLGIITAGAVGFLSFVGVISADLLPITGLSGGVESTSSIQSITPSETQQQLSPDEIQELIAEALSNSAGEGGLSPQLDSEEIIAKVLESIRTGDGQELRSGDIEQLVVQAVSEDMAGEKTPAPSDAMTATPPPLLDLKNPVLATLAPEPTPTPIPAPTPTLIATPSPSPSPSPKPTRTPTPRPTVTPIAPATHTPKPAPTSGPPPTPTPRPLPTLWPVSQLDPYIYSAREHYVSGVTHYKAGDCKLAIEQFSIAIEVDPMSFNPHSWRAYCYRNLGYYELAIQDYDWVIQSRPASASVHNGRGRSYRALGQYLLAIQDYDKALELEPNNVSAYNNRGFAYHLLDKHQRAIQDYDQALEIDPKAVYYYNRAMAHRAMGRSAEANQDKAEACALDSDYC